MASGEWKLKQQRSASVDVELEGPPEGEGPANTPSQGSSRSSLPSFVLTPPTTPTKKKRYDIKSWFTGSLDRGTSRINLSDAAVGQIQDQEISVYIGLTQFRLGTPQAPCTLQALGIVPRRHSITDRNPFVTLRTLRSKPAAPVIIRGITPSSPAALTDQLEPGDQILRVNGTPIDLKSIDNILQTISHEVILDVLKYSKPTPPDHTFSPPPNLSSSGWSPSPPPPSATPPLVLLLTLDTKEGDPSGKDVLYLYPPGAEQDPLLLQLVQLRGVVVTLCDISSTHFNAKESCCSLAVGGETFNAVGKRFDRDVFILVLPLKRGTVNHVTMLYHTLVASLVSLFGSVKRGLLSEDSNPTHIISSLFRALLPSSLSLPLSLSLSTEHSSLSDSFSFTSPTLPLKLLVPSRTTALVSAQLNQLDSGVYRTGSNSSGPSPIPFGSCIFYKGYLLVSHLLPSLLTAVTTVCVVNELLDLTAQSTVPQTVIWRQIHQTTPTNKQTPGYGTFVLIMAMERTLLCHVLDGVSVSTSVPPVTCSKKLRTLLEEVHSNGLLSECDGCILSQTPVLTTADVLLASLVSSSSSSIYHRGLSPKRYSAGSVRSLKLVANTGSIAGSIAGSQSDSDSDSAGTSSWLRNSQKKKKSGKFRSRLAAGLKKSKSTFSINIDHEHMNSSSSHQRSSSRQRSSSHQQLSSLYKAPYMLVAGIENLLLYFLTLDEGRGVVLCPCREQIGLQPVHKNLLTGFKDVAGAIHQILHKKYEEESEEDSDNEQEEEEEDGGVTRDRGGSAQRTSGNVFTSRGSPIREHGVLMECTIPIDVPFAAPKLLYWVIGRLFVEEEVELYICYQENPSQIPCEMLFKLVFGTIP